MKSSHNFFSDVIKLTSAPIITQAIGFFTLPIVTRLYNPESFGLFSTFTSIIGPIGVLVCLGYEISIMLPKEDEIAANILVMGLIITSIFTSISILIVLLCNNQFESLFGVQNSIKDYFWLYPIIIFMGGAANVFRYWNLRKKYFSRIAMANIASTTSEKVIILTAGFFGHATGLSLVFGTVIDSIVRPLFLGFKIIKDEGAFIKNSLNKRNLLFVIKNYRKFPMFILPTNVLSRFVGVIPIYLLSYYFSQTIVGYYAIGFRLLNIPMSLIGNSIGEVYFQRESENKSNNLFLLEKLFNRLVVFGIIPFLLLGLLGEEIFVFVFGVNWGEAGIYAQILSFMIFIRFITNPSNYLMIILEKQEYAFYLNIIVVLLTAISITVGGLTNNVYLSLVMMSFLSGLIYSFYGFWFMKYVGFTYVRILHTIGKTIMLALPLILALATSKWVLKFASSSLFIIAIIFTIFYYLIAVKHDEELYKRILKKIRTN